MSLHSRSSSEVEIITLRDVLPVLLKDFNKDFSYYDVKDMVTDIVSEENRQLILAESDVKKQNLKLFWILYEDETKLKSFLKRLNDWYPWLKTKVYNERDGPSKETRMYIEAERALSSQFPKHSNINVHRMQYYWQIRLALKKLKPYNHVVVSGELGVGKKWLVLDVCLEYSILNAMGYNIFWLDVHNCVSREDDFRALEQFVLKIGGCDARMTPSEFDCVENKILYLQQYIRDRLKQEIYKDCLLVLSDVPNSKAWKNLNLGCKTVIITKNRCIVDSLSKSTTTHISIDEGLTLSEYFQLFEKVLGFKRELFPKDATDIFQQSGGHPYLLSIIANNLKQSKQPNCWTEWIQNLKNLQMLDDKFTKIIKISLQVLKKREMELYKQLAIFPHSIKIPLKLLAAIWHITEQDAGRVLAKFDKYSVVNLSTLPDEGIACVLPFIYSSYLKADQEIDKTSLHKAVVNYYRIQEALDNRTEVVQFQNDKYFYHCIGYHLRESGYLDLFPKLFLDFGFLGEKLRLDEFPNTIGDLKYFKREITNNDPYKKKLVSELLNFLPGVVEMLFRSKDTCLLQYALMADGIIKEEAVKQASKFSHRIWFNEKGHFHQRRQIVCLPHIPKLVHLTEPDTCVIVLDNNDILFVDLSLDYNNDAIYLSENQYRIIKIEPFFEDNYLITLDVKGNLKVWSISDDRRRSASRKLSNRTKVNPLNLIQRPEMLKRKCIQQIQANDRGAIRTFHIEKLNDGAINLYLAFANGDICIHSWNAQREQFCIKEIPMLPTERTNIIYLSKVLAKYYMILSKSGEMFFYNLRDDSLTGNSIDWPQPPNLIYIQEYIKGDETHIIFVCSDQVLHLTLPKQTFEYLKGNLEYLCKIESGNKFLCARLLRDGKYLVLGTKRGLIVYNVEQKLEVLRGNISECITCVDIYPLDDKVFKYIIVCGSAKSKVLNLFALRQVDENPISWSHRLTNIPGAKSSDDANNPQFEPDVWLQGNKLFDLNYSGDSVILVAVDSKDRIHQLCTTDTKNWSISLPPQTSTKITSITAYNNNSFCGYDNGAIFNITNGVFEENFTNESITFLQLFKENILVASSNEPKQSIVRRIGDKQNMIQKIFKISIFKCFMLFDSYLILIDLDGGFFVVDLEDNFNLLHKRRDVPNLHLGGCDLKNNCLVMVTDNFKPFIYKFNNIDNKLVIKFVQYTDLINSDENDKITCIASSSDSSLFAVGLDKGSIDIYKMDESTLKFIYRLRSHISRIYDLKFSPNTEILVSCSEQLCFWHVSYILNNPFETRTRENRRSSRFRSSDSPVDEITNAITQLNHSENGETNLLHNPWSNKSGPNGKKPELLSCIKFVGHKAEIFYANDDFTQFNTIDDEGVYYHLCVDDISRKVQTNNLTNGNGHSIDADEEDDVVI